MIRYKISIQILLAIILSLAIMLCTTPIRYYDLHTDLLISPILFFGAGLILQYVTRTTYTGMLSVTTISVYIAIILVEAGIRNIGSIKLIELGFLNVVTGLLLAWLGQLAIKYTLKQRVYIVILSIIIVAIIYQFLYPIWYNYNSRLDLKKLDLSTNYNTSDKVGTKVASTELAMRKKYVVIDFWFQQCSPCWQGLTDLYSRYTNGEIDTNNVYIHTVNLYTKSDKITAESAFSKKGVSFPITYINQTQSDSMGLASFPTYLVYNQGRLILTTHEIDEVYKYLRKEGAVNQYVKQKD